MYRISETESRAGFRHELASTLGLFAVLLRHATPEHPGRLGPALSGLRPDASPASSTFPPVGLEREVLDLSAEELDLVAYLVCSHHGKVRTRLHAAPADQAAAPRDEEMPIRGVREGDELPATELRGAGGAMETLPRTHLTLEPAALGLSALTGRSWAERVEGLGRSHGPFTLAWLEAILRAADVRASRDVGLVDPALAPRETP
jgi:CRISPR-associated endonuclease/helicase Cas3